jgi:parallel beta-helix repeat protein
MLVPHGRRLLALTGGAIVLAVTLGATQAPHAGAGRAATASLSCGATVTSSVTLGNDLLECPANGLNVSGSHITVNLNGHLIEGTGGITYGVSVTGQGVTVENGTASGFWGGVLAEGAADRVQSMRVTENTHGISVAAANVVVTANTIFQNTGNGIEASIVSSPQITNNWSRGNAGDGIYFAGANGVVSGNRVISNGHDGIELGSGSGRQIIGNTANANGVNGIDAATLPGDTLSKNVAFFNTGLGINGGPADTDLGGNRAGGNGKAHQCEEVVCAS